VARTQERQHHHDLCPPGPPGRRDQRAVRCWTRDLKAAVQILGACFSKNGAAPRKAQAPWQPCRTCHSTAKPKAERATRCHSSDGFALLSDGSSDRSPDPPTPPLCCWRSTGGRRSRISGVVAGEIDTLRTEDPTEAKSGEISVLLEELTEGVAQAHRVAQGRQQLLRGFVRATGLPIHLCS